MFIEGKNWYGTLSLCPTQLCSSNLCTRAPMARSANANGQQMPHWQHQHTLSRSCLGSTAGVISFALWQFQCLNFLRFKRTRYTLTFIYFRISFGQKIKYILNDMATTERAQEVLIYGTGLQVSSCWCCLNCIWRVRLFWGLGWLCYAAASVLHLSGEELQDRKALMATCVLNILLPAVT